MTEDEWNALVKQPGWKSFIRYLRNRRVMLMSILAHSPAEAKGMDHVRIQRDVLRDLEDLDLETIRDFYGLDIKEKRPDDTEDEDEPAPPEGPEYMGYGPPIDADE